MLGRLFGKKDEFELFLEETDLEDIYYNLEEEESEKFKSSCYTTISISSDGEIGQGKLSTIRDRNKLVPLIASNLIYRKEYNIALKVLDFGISYDADNKDKAQYHISHALAYEKLKNVRKCNYHCWKAVELLHNGDYAYRRLVINHVKAKEFGRALEVCNIVLNRKDIFNGQTWGSLSEYVNRRREFILKQIKSNPETKPCIGNNQGYRRSK